MTPEELDNLVHRLLTGWSEAVGLRVVLLLVGAGILLLALTALLKRRCSFVSGLVWIGVGSLPVVFSLYPVETILRIVQTPYMTRIRVIIGAISLLMLLTTLESIRRTHLKERYALLWIATALALLLAAGFPKVVSLFRAVTGTEYATAVVAVAFAFLVLVAFHFSIALSAMESRQVKLAQRVALLEARLKRLERNGSDSGMTNTPHSPEAPS